MSGREGVLRLLAAALVGAMVIVALVLGTDPAPATPGKPIVKTVTVTETVAPDACYKFGRNADAFVEVTSEFLTVQNDAAQAVIDGDDVALGVAVDTMEQLQHRYDAVMDRYTDTRTGCL